jgi:hypothetical protein
VTRILHNLLTKKHAPADIDAIAAECKHLTVKELQLLHNLLTKYEHLFDCTLGTWRSTWSTDPIDIELKEPDCKLYHAKPYPVPDSSQEQNLQEEVNSLVGLKVLRKINCSEWAAPKFITSKKDGTLR